MSKTYGSKIQFRNAAKKAYVFINNDNEYSSSRLSIRASYDVNNKSVFRTEKESIVGFEFYSLDVTAALRLHAAGFELYKVEVPDFGGTKRTAFIYRLPLAK